MDDVKSVTGPSVNDLNQLVKTGERGTHYERHGKKMIRTNV